MSSVLGVVLVGQAYEQRLSLLKINGVGLWDVITTTEREGSLDSAIRNHEASDLHSLLDGLPRLRVIGFNGGTAARIGRRELGERASNYRLLDLPSSSPAYTLSFDAKLAQWMQLRDEQEIPN